METEDQVDLFPIFIKSVKEIRYGFFYNFIPAFLIAILLNYADVLTFKSNLLTSCFNFIFFCLFIFLWTCSMLLSKSSSGMDLVRLNKKLIPAFKKAAMIILFLVIFVTGVMILTFMEKHIAQYFIQQHGHSSKLGFLFFIIIVGLPVIFASISFAMTIPMIVYHDIGIISAFKKSYLALTPINYKVYLYLYMSIIVLLLLIIPTSRHFIWLKGRGLAIPYVFLVCAVYLPYLSRLQINALELT